MRNPNTASPDEEPIREEAVTPERFRSATAAIRRVLEGNTSLEDWNSAFSQVFALHGRAVNRDEDTVTAAARGEYRATLQKWHERLPRLREWLITQKKRIESRQAHGVGPVRGCKRTGRPAELLPRRTLLSCYSS